MNASRTYDRATLAEAAAECHTIEEVIAHLGTPPYERLGRYLMRRFTHYAIDVSHFRPTGRRPRPDPDRVVEAVARSVSIAETLRRLGRADNGAQRALLRTWVSEQGIDTSHFLGQAHQRSKRHAPKRRAEDVLVRHAGPRSRATRLRQALLDLGTPQNCAGCGTEAVWLGKPMTLEIDHVNGDPCDDRRENLRMLCPNCHAITSTWCRGGNRSAAP
ncbi:HNH endonuclease [Streptomyces sp. NBC_01335]|uniref:HNH endonuclease n=1 Tax=Streptomyces sp. NBC_01335 TaxID=2903828 RepID=UPI002E0F09BC|nr:HNH endonuclease [Streptomyces sp. NBC_01335]